MLRRLEQLSQSDMQDFDEIRSDWAEAWYGMTREEASQLASDFNPGEGGSSMSTRAAPNTSDGHEDSASVASKWTTADQAKFDLAWPESGSRPSSVADVVVERKDSATFESPTKHPDMQDGLRTNGETFRTDAEPKPSSKRVSISEGSECSFLNRPPSWINAMWLNGSRLGSARTASTVLDDSSHATENARVSQKEAGQQQSLLATLDAPFADPIWFPTNDSSVGSQVTISPSGIYGNAGSCSPRNSVVSSSPAHYGPVPIPPAYLDQNYYVGNSESALAHSASLASSTSDYDSVPIPRPYPAANAYRKPVAPARLISKGIFGGLRSARRHLPKLKQWKPSTPLRPRNLAFWGAKKSAALRAAEDDGYIV
jgi:hypothetical protein